MGIKVNRTPQAKTMSADDDDDGGIYQQKDACSCTTMLGVLQQISNSKTDHYTVKL